MPHIATWLVEGRLDPGHLVGERGHHVLRGVLDVLARRRYCCANDDVREPEACPDRAVELRIWGEGLDEAAVQKVAESLRPATSDENFALVQGQRCGR
jgi:hypothetical protein